MMPPLSEMLVSILLLSSGAVVFTAALGLHRLPDFFARMHAPAVASTLGVWLVALASIVHFSSGAEELRLQVWLIVIVLSVSAPVSTIVLARTALFRRRQSGDELPSPLRARDEGKPSDESTLVSDRVIHHGNPGHAEK